VLCVDAHENKEGGGGLEIKKKKKKIQIRK
jgi:hypothetical protein